MFLKPQCRLLLQQKQVSIKDKISIFRFGIKKIRVELMEDSVYLEMSNFKIFLYEDRMNTEYMSHGFSLKVYRNFGIENNIREPLNE